MSTVSLRVVILLLYPSAMTLSFSTNGRDFTHGNVSSVSFQRFVTSIGGLLLSGATCTVSLRGFFTFIIPFSPSYSTRGRDSIDGNVSNVSFQPFVSFECLLLSIVSLRFTLIYKFPLDPLVLPTVPMVETPLTAT